MEETIQKIKRLVAQVEKFRYCCFWERDLGNSEWRAEWTARESVAPFSWTEGGQVYTAEFLVEAPTCRECRAFGLYFRDGRKTTLKAVKGSLKRLEAAAG